MTGPTWRCRECNCHPARAETVTEPGYGAFDRPCDCECHRLAADLVDAALTYWGSKWGDLLGSLAEDEQADKARALLALCEKVEG